jgi:hypothetical protein
MPPRESSSVRCEPSCYALPRMRYPLGIGSDTAQRRPYIRDHAGLQAPAGAYADLPLSCVAPSPRPPAFRYLYCERAG